MGLLYIYLYFLTVGRVEYGLIYLLTAFGLSPGGSTHLHTNSTYNNTNNNRTTQIKQPNNNRVVGIATGYGLDGPGIESRLGARLSASVQNGPEDHPAFCIIGTGSFPGVKSGRGVTLTPQPF